MVLKHLHLFWESVIIWLIRDERRRTEVWSTRRAQLRRRALFLGKPFSSPPWHFSTWAAPIFFSIQNLDNSLAELRCHRNIVARADQLAAAGIYNQIRQLQSRDVVPLPLDLNLRRRKPLLEKCRRDIVRSPLVQVSVGLREPLVVLLFPRLRHDIPNIVLLA